MMNESTIENKVRDDSDESKRALWNSAEYLSQQHQLAEITWLELYILPTPWKNILPKDVPFLSIHFNFTDTQKKRVEMNMNHCAEGHETFFNKKREMSWHLGTLELVPSSTLV